MGKCHPFSGRYRTLAAVTVMIIAVISGLALTRGPRLKRAMLPPKAGKTSLFLGSQAALAVGDSPRGGDLSSVVCNKEGDFWVLLSYSGGERKGIVWAKRTRGIWTSPATLAAWKFIFGLKVIQDSLGNPCAIWYGFDEATGQAIAVSMWMDNGWSTPIILDRLPAGQSINSIDAIRDAEGALHVVYDRPLAPAEEYSRGLVIASGAFADKAFHAYFDGKQWSKPSPTTGRGRYSVNGLRLSNAPDGQVCLSAEYAPFGRVSLKNHYIGYQTWARNKWSSVGKILPPDEGRDGRNLLPALFLIDSWGLGHAWYYRTDVHQSEYYQVHGATASKAAFPGAALRPFVISNPKGGLASSCSGSVCLWDGNEWCEPLPVGENDGLTVSPSGRIFVWRWRERQVVIQEVIVKEE